MGSLHVLEALIVGVIMLSTVTYVVMLDAPPIQDDAAGRMLTDKAHDFLNIANEWLLPPAECDGRTQLERLLIQGLNENHTYWNQRTERFFGPGVDVSLLLDNTEGRYPIHEPYPFMGTTYDLPIQPDWSYTLPIPTTDSVDGTVRTVIETVGTHQGELVRPRGEATKVSISVEDTRVNQTLQAWSLTSLTGSGRDANITWTQNLGTSELQQVATYLPFDPENQFQFSLLRATANESFATNTTIEVRIPPGWSVSSSSPPVPPAGWNSSATGNATTGSLIQFTISDNATLGGTFLFLATPPQSPVRPFDVFHARLSKGGLGESSLVVTFPSAVEHSLPRAVYPTMPYPVQLGGRALMGAAFANGGPQTVVTRVDIEVPGGYDLTRNDGLGAQLFANASLEPVDTEDGNWSWVDAQHIQWVGNRTIESGKAGSWLIGVPITSDASQMTSIEPVNGAGPVSRLTFENGFVDESVAWGRAPGIIRHRVPPASDNATADGYPLPTEAQAITRDTTHVDAEISGPLATVTGQTDLSYSADAGDVTRLDSALTNSSFEVAQRLAPLGSLLHVNASLDSILTFVAANEYTDAQLEVELYAPPSLGCKPTASWTRDVTALPLASIRASSIFDAEGVGLPSAFFTGDDGLVYRFDTSGAPVWSQRLTGAGTTMATSTLGLAERAVFAGDGQGVVTRYDAGSGALGWRAFVERATGVAANVPSAIVSLHVDDTTGLLLVATADGVLEVRDASNGALVHRVESTGSFVTASWSPSGGVIAQTANWLRRYTADLSVVATVSVSAVAFTVAEPTFLVAEKNRIYRFDSSTFAQLGVVMLNSDVSLATAGDATGDGVPDIAYVSADGALVVHDGTTGLRAWTATPSVPTTVADPVTDHFFPRNKRADLRTIKTTEGDVELDTCKGKFTVSSTRYTADVACAAATAVDSADSPVALHASDGRVTVGVWHGGITSITHVDGAGSIMWTDTLQNDAPTTITHGAWGLLGNAVFVGTSQGIARVVDEATGQQIYHERATQAAGKFTFVLPVPEGGFFGSHVLVAKVTWTTADGHQQTARLSDWFEVVGKDGRPVTKPIYRAVLVVAKSDAPLGVPSE